MTRENVSKQARKRREKMELRWKKNRQKAVYKKIERK